VVKRSLVRWAFIASLAAVALAGACNGVGLRGGGAGDPGAVNIALELGNGATITGASYTITGPGGFNKSGSVNVGNSATVSIVVGGLPAGSGYAIAIAATSSDGATGCGGSASFGVTAGVTGAVTVHLTCRQAPTTGSVSVNGTLNICPNLEGIGASQPR
jgi:hypothetical protein